MRAGRAARAGIRGLHLRVREIHVGGSSVQLALPLWARELLARLVSPGEKKAMMWMYRAVLKPRGHGHLF